MTLAEAIAEAARLIRSSISDNETVELLTALDVPRPTAEEILAFLPIVYGRELLRRSGCTDFPADYFRRLPNNTTSQPIPLARKPVWRECEKFLRTDLASGSRGDDLLLLATCSHEFQTAHRLLDQGSVIEDITFPPLVLTTSEEGPIDS